jgi:transposase
VERKAIYSPEEKLQIVLSVLHGETTQTEISRRLQMSQTTIAKWRRQFLDGDAQGLGRGDRPKRPANRREEELEEKVEDLASALGEAYVELRVWRKGGLSTRVRGDRGPEARMPVARLVRRVGIPSGSNSLCTLVCLLCLVPNVLVHGWDSAATPHGPGLSSGSFSTASRR